MKYYFSDTSEINLISCYFDLQVVAKKALAMDIMDIACIWGHRGEEDQNEAYKDGNSPFEWPNSMHNKIPSNAMDLAPIIDGKIPWKEDDPNYWMWYQLSGMILVIAKKWNVELEWGKDFEIGKGDLGHYQRIII